MEEMEKRSDRHIRDLVAHTAFKGLEANEIGCARISVMAGSNCSLQRAEYRSAGPIISRPSYPTCNARPVHTDVPGPVMRSRRASAPGPVDGCFLSARRGARPQG